MEERREWTRTWQDEEAGLWAEETGETSVESAEGCVKKEGLSLCPTTSSTTTGFAEERTGDDAESTTGNVNAGAAGELSSSEEQEGDGQEEEDADEGC